jgi:hypothetical protein
MEDLFVKMSTNECNTRAGVRMVMRALRDALIDLRVRAIRTGEIHLRPTSSTPMEPHVRVRIDWAL